MNSRDLSRLMWGEALSLLEQADRLHRQFFQPAALPPGRAQAPAWEPPVDVIEGPDEIRVEVALPGVEAGSVVVSLEPDAVAVSARRPFPTHAGDGRAARIRALEIPYGRFQRRIALPMQALVLAGKKMQDGCLTLIFRRKESS
ncbi:MAG TPA: Hsp20/alpha crystallin family protein [Burkholderiales bacterium]|jgi:HSP20 family molecular chaperone IbpA|nr:Hsp20/alpha crystallin family protein [Burkholderiales bacterium]